VVLDATQRQDEIGMPSPSPAEPSQPVTPGDETATAGSETAEPDCSREDGHSDAVLIGSSGGGTNPPLPLDPDADLDRRFRELKVGSEPGTGREKKKGQQGRLVGSNQEGSDPDRRFVGLGAKPQGDTVATAEAEEGGGKKDEQLEPLLGGNQEGSDADRRLMGPGVEAAPPLSPLRGAEQTRTRMSGSYSTF